MHARKCIAALVAIALSGCISNTVVLVRDCTVTLSNEKGVSK